ncbi:MAG: prolipoprotein diacylglyceryl transferase [Planctomycetes bacterium]|nr:prolipoprotein diacylglyceryl transferase [Planctomycetota bacterium]
MHPTLEIPGQLVGLVLLALGVAWGLGWQRCEDPEERKMAPFGVFMALGGVVLLTGVVGTITWPTYGFAMASGCAVLAALTIYWARKTKLMSVEHMLEMLLLTGLCGLIGARAVYLIETWDSQFADHPAIMAAAGLLDPLSEGDTLELTLNREAPFTVTFQGDETTLTQVKERLEAAGAAHGLVVQIETTQHRGDEGVVVTERGLLLETRRRGVEARLSVLGGTAVKKLGLIPNSMVQGVPTPLSKIFNIRGGGLTYFGSVIGVLLSAIVYLRIRKVSVLRMLDLVAPALPLGLFFGRLGCLAHGCCWGREAGENALLTVKLQQWTPAWAQFAGEKLPCTFDAQLASRAELTPDMVAALGPLATSTPALHATQLYEGLSVLLIFFLALAYRRWLQHRLGQAFAFVVLLQAPVRFVVEHFRRDLDVFFQVPGYAFTESQLVAIGMFTVAVPAMIYLTREAPRLDEVSPDALANAEVSAEESPTVAPASTTPPDAA